MHLAFVFNNQQYFLPNVEMICFPRFATLHHLTNWKQQQNSIGHGPISNFTKLIIIYSTSLKKFPINMCNQNICTSIL